VKGLRLQMSIYYMIDIYSRITAEFFSSLLAGRY
jgi:hypothetical protein